VHERAVGERQRDVLGTGDRGAVDVVPDLAGQRDQRLERGHGGGVPGAR
jgi:hypothetical protein